MSTPLPRPFSALLGVAEEVRTNASYFFDNRRRGSPEEAIVQQTLSGAAFLEGSSGRRLVPKGHAMLFTHCEDSAYGYPSEATAPYHQRYLAFQLGALRPWFDRLRAEFGAVLRMSFRGEASATFDEIMRRFHARDFRDRFQESELLHQLLVALYREQVAATETQDPIEFGYHYLRDRFRSPLNLKELAARCGVSREHFIRGFRKRYGEPPGELLRRLRLEQAQRMLAATQVPVQEVALACGFADANSFCRAYRVRYGAPPGASRRNRPAAKLG